MKTSRELRVEEMCPDCKNPNGEFMEDFANGDMICRDCGLVVGDRIVDVRSEWRNFADSGDDPSRASRVNDWLPSGGLATEIAKLPTGPNGQNNGQGGGGKMSQWQRRIQLSQGDQNLLSGFDKITHIAEILVLPQKIKNKAKELYSSFESKRNKSMRCKKDSIVAAIIYMACKEEGVPRTFKEISKETEISEKEIRKYYRALNKILPKGTGRTSASDLVNRFCSKLKLSNEIMNLATDIANKAAAFLEGKSPSSIAAASILLATKLQGEKRWEKDIAAAASISPTTIRNVFKELLPHQESILPEGYRPLQNATA